LFLGVTITGLAEAQVLQEWIQQKSGMWGAGVVLDSDGNAYVTGPSLLDASHNFKEDVVTVKYDPAGNEVWVREFDETADSTHGSDVPNWLTLDPSGNLIIAGYSYLFPEGNRFLILKYDPAGNLLWRARSTIGASAVRVATDAAGNIYATGSTAGTAGANFVTAKFDSAGNQVWLQTYNGPSNFADNAAGLDVTAGGSVVVTGRSAGGVSGYDFATIVYNTDGSTRWIQRYSGPAGGTDQPSDVAFGPDESVYAGGFEGMQNNTDFSLVKYASDGTFLWVRTYNGPPNKWDAIKRLRLDSAGNILVTGYEQQSNFYSDFATLKYDPDGNQLWIQRLNLVASGDEIPFSMVIGSNDAIYIAGESGGKLALVKYNESGQEEWHVTYDNPGNLFDRAQSIATGSNRVVITGTSPILTASYTEEGVNLPPVAVITADRVTGTVPLTVNFSSTNSLDKDGTIVSYFWDFGDQSTSNAPNPSHVYNKAGSYNVVLRVFDDDGLTAGDRELIVVNAASTLFYEDFADVDISDWQKLSGRWSVINQTLQGQDRRKAEILSPFAGCGNCSAEADIQLQSAGADISMLGWYVDERNYVEIILMAEKDMVVLKQRSGGTIILKAKHVIPIEPGVTYRLKAVFNGTTFSVYLNGNLVITKSSSVSPFGKFGFRAKGSGAAIMIDNFLIQ
jgi:uncharacterized delta-60 repeat protein